MTINGGYSDCIFCLPFLGDFILKKMKKGSSVSFTNQQTGKKHTGTYQGMKTMGGRSYAHVEHPKGVKAPNMVPVHHIH